MQLDVAQPRGSRLGNSIARITVIRITLIISALLLAGVLVWQALTSAGVPDPTLPDTSSLVAILDIGVLVFREGLECILVLAAIVANRSNSGQLYRRPITLGTVAALVATLITWRIAVGIVDSLTESVPALDVQAATGLLAVVVLVIVMNWFFHKVYWTGWIAMHTKKKRELLQDAAKPDTFMARVLWGLGLLGFTSVYREGFEVVLFLQSYRLKLGGTPVLYGVMLGLSFTAIIAVLTFVAHRKLPYRKMLVLTGVLLGVVLLVMVGEQALEMQLAGWIPTTPIKWLEGVIPAWMGLWFSIFPTVETLVAQLLAAVLVLGSYGTVRLQMARRVAPVE